MNGNIFESAVGWLLGFKTDAVRQQQVSWMAYYNANWLLGTAGRPATPKRFYSVVGTDVETAVWDSDSYCGGYTENLGLEEIGRASCGKECVSTCRSRWSPYH